MHGIVAIPGTGPGASQPPDALERLEYCGHDPAGTALAPREAGHRYAACLRHSRAAHGLPWGGAHVDQPRNVAKIGGCGIAENSAWNLYIEGRMAVASVSRI